MELAEAGRRLLRFWPVPLVVALDLWSKAAVFAWLGRGTAVSLQHDPCGHERYPVAGDWLAFMLSRNRGMAFGFLDRVPRLLIGGRVLAVLAITWLLWSARTGRATYTLGLALVLGGAIGNLYDNLFLPAPPNHPFGEVRDFIDVYLPAMGDLGPFFDSGHFPTFNVADSCITVGAILLLLSGLRAQPHPETAAPASS